MGEGMSREKKGMKVRLGVFLPVGGRAGEDVLVGLEDGGISKIARHCCSGILERVREKERQR